MQFLSDLSTLLHILTLTIILVCSLLVILVIPRVKIIENGKAKTILYIVLGIVAFTLVGTAYNLWQPSGHVDAGSIVQPYIQFYPIFILSLVIAAVVLATYMDREKYGYIFAGTGFAVILPDVLTYISNGRYDLILLICVLWAIIPAIWVRTWKESVYKETTLKEKVITSLKSAIITYPVYVMTALVAAFGESGRGIEGSLSNVFTFAPDIIKFILVTLWLYLLITVIIVSLMFVIHGLAIQTFNIKRIITRKNEIRYIVVKPAEPVKEKAMFDAYRSLIDEMQVFYKYMDNVDRIQAAPTIARFKNEYYTLAAKYNDGSREEAEKMIKTIEMEFKNRY